MREIFINFQKPQWEYKFGDVNFASIKKRKLSYLLTYQPSLYQLAYSKFFNKIKTFNDYSKQFKLSKKETGKILNSWISGKKILSWGCGTAFIEETMFNNENITLMDQAVIKNIGIRKIYSKNILKTWRGDCIIGIQLVVHMNINEVKDFFHISSEILNEEGLLIISHISRNNILEDILDIGKGLLKFLIYRRRTYVLWGWRRSNYLYKNLAKTYSLKLKKIIKNNINNEDILIFERLKK